MDWFGDGSGYGTCSDSVATEIGGTGFRSCVSKTRCAAGFRAGQGRRTSELRREGELRQTPHWRHASARRHHGSLQAEVILTRGPRLDEDTDGEYRGNTSG